MEFSCEAGRVHLRHLQAADLPAFAACRADSAVVRFQGFEACCAFALQK